MSKKDDDRVLVRVGRQIRRMRQGAGMTPAEFARKLRVSKEVVRRIENGQQDLRLDALFEIARIFGRCLKFRIVNRRRRYEEKK